MTDEERYLFDLQGYLVIKQALASEQVAELNGWITEQSEQDPRFDGNVEHLQIPDFIGWGQPFLNLLDNPKVVPYLKEILGASPRLDHHYAVFLKPGSKKGLPLHGGATPYDPSQFYHCINGVFYNGLSVVAYALTDSPLGDGGFACVPGSHKSNFTLSEDICWYRKPFPAVIQVPLQAGDCILFTEALTHGTLPWKGEGIRRTLFLKFSPGYMAWANTTYLQMTATEEVIPDVENLTETQRILLQPPSVWQRKKLK